MTGSTPYPRESLNELPGVNRDLYGNLRIPTPGHHRRRSASSTSATTASSAEMPDPEQHRYYHPYRPGRNIGQDDEEIRHSLRMTSHSQLADHLAQTHLGPPQLRNRSTSSGAIPTATAIVEHLSRQDRRFLPSSRRSSPPGQPGLIVASPQIDRDNFPIPATLATTASELHPRTGMEETLYTTGSEELELVEEDRKAVSGCDLPLKMAVLVHYSKKRLDSAPGETVFRDRAALYVARYLRLDEILVHHGTSRSTWPLVSGMSAPSPILLPLGGRLNVVRLEYQALHVFSRLDDVQPFETDESAELANIDMEAIYTQLLQLFFLHAFDSCQNLPDLHFDDNLRIWTAIQSDRETRPLYVKALRYMLSVEEKEAVDLAQDVENWARDKIRKELEREYSEVEEDAFQPGIHPSILPEGRIAHGVLVVWVELHNAIMSARAARRKIDINRNPRFKLWTIPSFTAVAESSDPPEPGLRRRLTTKVTTLPSSLRRRAKTFRQHSPNPPPRAGSPPPEFVTIGSTRTGTTRPFEQPKRRLTTKRIRKFFKGDDGDD